MSHRPLVLVSGLTFGDYLLWNWSVGANHDVVALVSGLTLPPLLVACVWLLALSVARLLAHGTRRAPRRSAAPGAGSHRLRARRTRAAAASAAASAAAGTSAARADSAATAANASGPAPAVGTRSSRKIAA